MEQVDLKQFVQKLCAEDVDSMQVFAKTATGKTITLDIKASDTIDKLKSAILDASSSITFAGKPLKDGSKTLADCKILPESTLFESSRLDGGVKKTIVKQKHVAPKQALKQMQSKLKAEVEEAIAPVGENLGSLPTALRNVVDPIREKMAELDGLVRDGDVDIIADLLKGCTDAQLVQASDILNKKSGVLQAERFVQLANALICEIQMVDTAVDHLTLVKQEMVLKFCMILSSEFHFERNGTVHLAADKLLVEVQDVQKYRRVIHDVARTTPGACADEVIGRSSKCCIS